MFMFQLAKTQGEATLAHPFGSALGPHSSLIHHYSSSVMSDDNQWELLMIDKH